MSGYLKRWLQHADNMTWFFLLGAGWYLYIGDKPDQGMFELLGPAVYAFFASMMWQAKRAETEALAPFRLLRAS